MFKNFDPLVLFERFYGNLKLIKRSPKNPQLGIKKNEYLN